MLVSRSGLSAKENDGTGVNDFKECHCENCLCTTITDEDEFRRPQSGKYFFFCNLFGTNMVLYIEIGRPETLCMMLHMIKFLCWQAVLNIRKKQLECEK